MYNYLSPNRKSPNLNASLDTYELTSEVKAGAGVRSQKRQMKMVNMFHRLICQEEEDTKLVSEILQKRPYLVNEEEYVLPDTDKSTSARGRFSITSQSRTQHTQQSNTEQYINLDNSMNSNSIDNESAELYNNNNKDNKDTGSGRELVKQVSILSVLSATHTHTGSATHSESGQGT
tara:strand:+ start:356 stop:883 length:528 start_codon:yes stop_codon:yes gene_type:complete